MPDPYQMQDGRIDEKDGIGDRQQRHLEGQERRKPFQNPASLFYDFGMTLVTASRLRHFQIKKRPRRVLRFRQRVRMTEDRKVTGASRRMLASGLLRRFAPRNDGGLGGGFHLSPVS
ncbi:MAG: hypothetical protein LBF93_10860 [Zoogloeaceae bacterium]|jgi:hypothetical protein|nr:hypothetical protein [Zoogloeaceae bacterium]